MTRSSKSRKSKALAKKRIARALATSHKSEAQPSLAQYVATLSSTDKRFYAGFALMSLLITVGYWSLGGRNLFVFPALFCIAVGIRSYWR